MKAFWVFTLGLGLSFFNRVAAQYTVEGTIEDGAGATVQLGRQTAVADTVGRFTFTEVPRGTRILRLSLLGFEPYTAQLSIVSDTSLLPIRLTPQGGSMDEVVVTGTMRAVQRSLSPVAVEVYSPQFFKKNPAPSLFESFQNVNGVRPQINCSICNTGDIHINGLEGPYTMVTIDGMPIVSALSSVYGLFGIPASLIERVEVVKGPASGLYGSEAIGGLINVITKAPGKAPRWSGAYLGTGWGEHNLDLAHRLGKGKVKSLAGLNYFRYDNPVDNNSDGFTDATLQNRIALFSKTSFERRDNRQVSLAARYIYEDRWGGQMDWLSKFRGGDSVYGESIYTSRGEILGMYDMPTALPWTLQFSGTLHNQNAAYGNTPYIGRQGIGFVQSLWRPRIAAGQEWLIGTALRYNYYDDNSTATLDTLSGANRADRTWIPGVFVQNETEWGRGLTGLLGLRWDHHRAHGSIFTPRLAVKKSFSQRSTLRLNAGTGFRVVNLFTEDHAALTGARAVEIREALKPERSLNLNANYTQQFRKAKSSHTLDLSVWYSRFSNQIIPDYDTDPQKIIYANLEGYAQSTGLSVNMEGQWRERLRYTAGLTVQDMRIFQTKSSNEYYRPVLNERWSGVWTLSYSLPLAGLSFDYSGNLYGPMRLPLLGNLDPRPEYSPVWSIQNFQLTKTFTTAGLEFFGGVKNLLNFTPGRRTRDMIARAQDPFDKRVTTDNAGNVLVDPVENPHALTFDPTYAYAPNQGRRVFAGVRFSVK